MCEYRKSALGMGMQCDFVNLIVLELQIVAEGFGRPQNPCASFRIVGFYWRASFEALSVSKRSLWAGAGTFGLLIAYMGM